MNETLIDLDKGLFRLINHDLDSSLLDPVMIIARNPYTWAPFYTFLLIYSIFRMQKNAWPFILLSLLVFGMTDLICAQLIKPLAGRLRPCFDPEMDGLVRSLVDCGGRYSFPSNHAANHFALASYWYLAIKEYTGKKWSFLWIWAALVCYAQVYVGKHFPVDVIGGAIFGTFTGSGIYLLFRLYRVGPNYMDSV